MIILNNLCLEKAPGIGRGVTAEKRDAAVGCL